MLLINGKVAEWLNAAVSKTVVRRSSDRGFESPPFRNMFYTYVLKSTSIKRNYFGSSSNLTKRLHSHNAGKVRSTKAFRPWKVIYFEVFENKSDALKRELFFKSIDGYNFLKSKGII